MKSLQVQKPARSSAPLLLRSSVPPLTLLLAFALRVYRLSDANVWWDEGWTLWLSRFDLVSIALRTARDEHPPLHYWLMHYWDALAGLDAFAGRFFSVFFGVLTVAIIYRLAKKFGGWQLGALAALLLAVARFHVWWSQDIKNYTLSSFFAWLAVYFALQILPSPRSPRSLDKGEGKRVRVFVAYIFSMTLALYSHYLAALIFLVVNLFAVFAIFFLKRQARQDKNLFLSALFAAKNDLARWTLAQLAVLALFAPWLYLYLQNAATWSAAPPFDFGLFLQLAATVLSLGVTTNIENYFPVVAAFMVIAVCGILSLAVRQVNKRKEKNRFSLPSQASFASLTLLALLVVAIPPLLIYILSLTPAAFFAPKIQPRYLLILLPGFILLLASGIFFLARFTKYLALAACAFVLLAQVWTLNDYFGTRVLRDDYFTLANVVNSFARAGDTVLLDTDQEWPTFLYYQRAAIPWVGVPNATPLTEKDANDLANNLAARFDGVWLVTIPDALAKDPQHLVEQKLAQVYPKLFDREFGDKRLTLYARTLHNLKDVPPENYFAQHPLNDEFASDLRLSGFDQPLRDARGGDTLHVVTYWAAEDLANITLELRDANGAAVQSDTQPISIGAHERVQSDLTLPPRASSDFTIVARAKLTTRTLATIQATPRIPPLNTNAITHPLDDRLGDSIRLVGFDLPRQDFRAGDSVALTLYWRADTTVATSYKVFVHLVGSQFNPATNNPLWGQVDQIPLAGELPTNAWDVGDVIPDAYNVSLAPNAPSGEFQIAVGLYDPATGARLRVFDSNGNDVGDEIVIARIVVK